MECRMANDGVDMGRRKFLTAKPEPFDPDWKGGYFCPCHKSRYDMAGRVFQGAAGAGQPAGAAVPLRERHTIVIGLDPQGPRKPWRTSSPVPPPT
jgi:Rieske Fe-S protein